MKRDWTLARAWLHRELAAGRGDDPDDAGALAAGRQGLRRRARPARAGARRHFLTQACGGDDALRREVAALLARAARGRRPLRPAGRGALRAARRGRACLSWVGRRVGPYRLTRELGEGGMGGVYEAVRDDDQFHKRVALKMVKPGRETGAVLRRFRYERQILAGLDHPNIAALLDGGVTDDGRPYFVMEFVEGEPIDRYCARRNLDRGRAAGAVRQRLRRGAARPPQPGRPPRPQAQQHPGDRRRHGEAARLRHRQAARRRGRGGSTGLTEAGVHAMTPDYASPEQVRGDAVTTASDVYSLGVVLYELLAGQRPYRLEGLPAADMIRVVCERGSAPPQRGRAQPRATPRRSRGELDNIVLMALRKEPARRYSSVEQLGGGPAPLPRPDCR